MYVITDVTGIELTPGHNGDFYKGSGKHIDKNGVLSDCCCDECDYAICCFVMKDYDNCDSCFDADCPHSQINKIENTTTKEGIFI